MSAPIRCTKRAWIRDPNAPVGKPALGRINCPCGQAPLSAFSPEQGDITCACGTVYTWDGWVKSQLSPEARANFEADKLKTVTPQEFFNLTENVAE